ncbi:OST-HTH/LOTUS domain-containing protein [Nocardioides scoriae]|uniref:OST-HTH/LOTUS domain-containing protein n=1 Tax=Nocardioides scoriae TaxID=642780 RepID=A0A1H1NBZ4_9ACTN|nr:NYN domain-containing protein [Nocardioides scoriae]SDR96458.1 OST-HTH/LOTUS domain-containing protein [Nocardioides scoriae]
MTDSRRLAVLIDADNVSSKVSTDLFAELAGYGLLTVKRAYGDWTTDQLNGWKKRLHEHAISPMQQFAYTTGKNSSDSALIIDAMDLLYAGNLDGFVIVSSDSDFTRLATRLRESAMTVYGVGASKTPRAFRDACDKFTFLEVLQAGAPVEEDEPAPRSRRSGQRGNGNDAPPEAVAETREAPEAEMGSRESAAALQSVLSRSLNKADSDDEDWTTVSALGSLLTRVDPSFDARTHGFARLSDLIREQPFLETRTVTTAAGQEQLMVRLKGRRGSGRGSRRGRGDNRLESKPEATVETRSEAPEAAPAPAAEVAPEPTPEVVPGRTGEPVDQPAADPVAEPATVAVDAPVAGSADPVDEQVDERGDEPVEPAAEEEPPAKAPRKRAAAKKTTAKKAPAAKTAATRTTAKKTTARKTAKKAAAEPAPEPEAPAVEAPVETPTLTVTTRRTPRRAAKRAAGPSVPTE